MKHNIKKFKLCTYKSESAYAHLRELSVACQSANCPGPGRATREGRLCSHCAALMTATDLGRSHAHVKINVLEEQRVLILNCHGVQSNPRFQTREGGGERGGGGSLSLRVSGGRGSTGPIEICLK
jgi:hypothetical protein